MDYKLFSKFEMELLNFKLDVEFSWPNTDIQVKWNYSRKKVK